MATASMGMGFLLAYLYGRTLAPLIILAGIALLWMYSFPPVKLSYRGGGEFLQMLGVGVVLPIVGFYAQSGTIMDFPMEAFAVILPTQLACAMGTSIPDYQSDKASNKRTSTVLLGVFKVRTAIIVLNLVSIGAFFLLTWQHMASLRHTGPLVAVALVALVLLFLMQPKPERRHIFLFVLFSILVTTGVMGSLSYMAANFVI
jgi:1,4-dihydroxy-2-naphthoate octaprenyltransferase